MTTRIDFHSNVTDQLQYAYRLVRKAFAAQCHLVVYHQDENQLTQFDQLLWQNVDTDFLPHVVLKQGNHLLKEHTPILLTLASEALSNSDHSNKILLNLSNGIPPNFSQFMRLIEIVPQEQQSTQAGRERYRCYLQQGYQPNHIQAQ